MRSWLCLREELPPAFMACSLPLPMREQTPALVRNAHDVNMLPDCPYTVKRPMDVFRRQRRALRSCETGKQTAEAALWLIGMMCGRRSQGVTGSRGRRLVHQLRVSTGRWPTLVNESDLAAMRCRAACSPVIPACELVKCIHRHCEPKAEHVWTALRLQGVRGGF
jgi:hypothetical protein